MRVGAVDLGTNSTRLLVADVEDGTIHELERRLTITRLGEGVDSRRRLLPPALARVRNCLSDYRRAAEGHGAERVLALGTSAVRDAENGEAFLGEIEWSYGFATRLLSGGEEARLTWRGVTAGRELEPGTMILDVGGGSTELVGEDSYVSLDLGCVRMTERHGEDLEALDAAARDLLATVERRPTKLIGVAGTVSTLAMLDLGLSEYDRDRVHGHALSAGAVAEQLHRLAFLPLDERRELPGLEPDRAPVIVAGAAIVYAVLGHFGLDELEESEQDLLDGAALAAAELPEAVEGDAPPGAYTCC